MLSSTVSCLDAWYASVFGLDRSDLWQRVTVEPRTRPGPIEGYYIVWRGDGVHVSMPPEADLAVHDELTAESIKAIQDVPFWRDFAAARSLRVVGPSKHTYLDTDPGSAAGVVAVDAAELSTLRALVDEQDWAESGWNDQPAHTFGLYDEGQLVAASNLNSFAGKPRDIGVLVAPAWRGRDLSTAVGRHAASFAVHHYDFARWGARTANRASCAAARRLGFQPWCSQLAIR